MVLWSKQNIGGATMAQSETIGFVGLGNMGWPMAGNLCKAGFMVVSMDTDAKRQAAFATTFGAEMAVGPESFARTDRLITMLPDGNIVADVLVGAGGLLRHLPKDSLVIDMSSGDPAAYDAITPDIERLGHAMIDAPVSGGTGGAEAGTLTIMTGGDDAAIDRALPLFEVMGGKIFRTGGFGSGQAMKALNNLASATALMVTIEVLITAQRFGLDPALVNSILNVSTGRNNSTDKKIAPHVLSRTFDSGFGLSLMAKDLRTAHAIAERTKTSVPLSDLAVQMAQQASEALGPDADHTAVALWIEDRIGEALNAS